MSTPKSADPNDYVTWRVAVAGVILLILLGALGWMMFDAGDSNKPTSSKVDSTKPVGEVVDVTKADTRGSAFTSLMLWLKTQPSDEATLNALAQAACKVTDELQRRHPDDTDAQYLDPLYKDRFLLVFDIYNASSDHTDGNQPIEERQRKYCKVYAP